MQLVSTFHAWLNTRKIGQIFLFTEKLFFSYEEKLLGSLNIISVSYIIFFSFHVQHTGKLRFSFMKTCEFLKKIFAKIFRQQFFLFIIFFLGRLLDRYLWKVYFMWHFFLILGNFFVEKFWGLIFSLSLGLKQNF